MVGLEWSNPLTVHPAEYFASLQVAGSPCLCSSPKLPALKMKPGLVRMLEVAVVGAERWWLQTNGPVVFWSRSVEDHSKHWALAPEPPAVSSPSPRVPLWRQHCSLGELLWTEVGRGTAGPGPSPASGVIRAEPGPNRGSWGLVFLTTQPRTLHSDHSSRLAS